MAEILVTSAGAKTHYTPIASIKRYKEPDFESKLLQYGEAIFGDYFVMPCKFDISSVHNASPLQPDLILIEKNFTKWVLVEVELCKAPNVHTVSQIKCFSEPKFDEALMAKYLAGKHSSLKGQEAVIEKMFRNVPSEFIVVMDDYSNEVFEKFRTHIPKLKICVMEVYKTPAHVYETYRFGGDYPHVLTSNSKLEWVDEQHYIIQNQGFARTLPQDDPFELRHEMDPFLVTVFYSPRSRKYFLKMPEHHLPKELYLQMGIDVHGNFILQRL